VSIGSMAAVAAPETSLRCPRFLPVTATSAGSSARALFRLCAWCASYSKTPAALSVNSSPCLM